MSLYQLSPFRILSDEQTTQLQHILRLHEVLTNTEYTRWATDSYADITRPLHSLASELHRRADTQVVTRHPSQYDEDVKQYIRLALVVGSTLEPGQSKDGAGPTLLSLLSPVMDIQHAEPARKHEMRLEKLTEREASELVLDETQFLDYVKPSVNEEEDELAKQGFKW